MDRASPVTRGRPSLIETEFADACEIFLIIRIRDLESDVIIGSRRQRLAFHRRYPHGLRAICDDEEALFRERKRFFPAVIDLSRIEHGRQKLFRPVEIPDDESDMAEAFDQ